MNEPTALQNTALITDLYELTMAAAYFENNFNPRAAFELFTRRLPEGRTYLVCAGLEQALDYLEGLHFTEEQVKFLQGHPAFRHVSEKFFEYLLRFRFSGDAWAMPEGTPVFATEPMLRVSGPLIEAQIVETFLLTTITFQTLIASKAMRVMEAAQGRGVVEFGSRRAHGPESGVLAARAAYIGGCIGTSNVEAGFRFGIPTYGTMAHSFVMAYADEDKAFQDFNRVFPENGILILDTYDTLAAVEKIVRSGVRATGVRLDSGDIEGLAKEVRARLDEAGLGGTKIFASGDLDELAISSLMASGAPIDSFGVGTELATSRDSPTMGGVYKLVEIERDGQVQPAAKFSEHKSTCPYAKQVFRFERNGCLEQDRIAHADERSPDGVPLLVPVMRNGKRNSAPEKLELIRQRASKEIQKLPKRFRQLHNAETYPVSLSDELKKKAREFETTFKV